MGSRRGFKSNWVGKKKRMKVESGKIVKVFNEENDSFDTVEISMDDGASGLTEEGTDSYEKDNEFSGEDEFLDEAVKHVLELPLVVTTIDNVALSLNKVIS